MTTPHTDPIARLRALLEAARGCDVGDRCNGPQCRSLRIAAVNALPALLAIADQARDTAKTLAALDASHNRDHCYRPDVGCSCGLSDVHDAREQLDSALAKLREVGA